MLKLGRAYMHTDSGKELITQEFAKVKIGTEWVDGIIYSESKVDKYVRTIADFESKCVLITK